MIDGITLHRSSMWLLIIATTLVINCRSQDFSPNVQTRCIDGRMMVTVRTPGPFRGIIYTSDRQADCRVSGTGARETLIDIPLTDFDRCNVHYDPDTEEYSVVLNVHEHPIIILQQDRVFNVSCSRSTPEVTNPFNTNNFSEPKLVQMGVYRQDAKIHHVLFGNPYTIRIESDGREDFSVTSCFGFAGQNDSLRLTDTNGCSTDMALIGNFVYDPNSHTAQAPVLSMFKFPEHEMIHLQCSVELCNGACPRVDCERRRDDPFPSHQIERNPFPQKQKKRRFTSTTIRVSESEIAPEERLTDLQEVAIDSCSRHYQLLSAMCILFACLFLGSIFVNFLFCCLAGYCCCSNSANQSHRMSSSPMDYVDPATFDRIMANRTRHASGHEDNFPYPGISFIESPSRNSAVSRASVHHQPAVRLAQKRIGKDGVGRGQPSPGSASAQSFTSDKPLMLMKKRGSRVHPHQELAQYLATDDLPPPPKSMLASHSHTSSPNILPL